MIADAEMDDVLKETFGGKEPEAEPVDNSQEPIEMAVADDEPAQEEAAEDTAPIVEEPKEDLAPAMTYEEYVEAGRDPEKYMGPAALEQYREKISERKGYRDESKENKRIIELLEKQEADTAKAFIETQRAQREASEARLAELESQIPGYRDSLDVEGLEKAIEEKNALQNQQQAQPEQNQEHHVIAAYRQENERLSVGANTFDQGYNDEFSRRLAFEASGYGNQVMTDDQVRQAVDKVANSFGGQPKEQPRPRKAAPVASGGRSPAGAKSTVSKADQEAFNRMPNDTKNLYNRWIKGSADEKQYAKELIANHSNSRGF